MDVSLAVASRKGVNDTHTHTQTPAQLRSGKTVAGIRRFLGKFHGIHFGANKSCHCWRNDTNRALKKEAANYKPENALLEKEVVVGGENAY